MTEAQYWDGDPTLVRAYRKAHRLQEDRLNSHLWLQGMYFYEALCDASPIFHDLAKPGTTAHPYAKEPYDLHPQETERKERRKQDKAVSDKGYAYMTHFMHMWNAKMSSKQKDPP